MNSKKTISRIMLCILTISLLHITVFAQENISVLFNGDYISFDVPPQTINGRTMVPIRAIFETMGATVDWNNNLQSAICTKGDTTVKMTLNSPIMYINNQSVIMDVSPVIINNRTLAPARYVAEAFGYQVDWDASNQTVKIGGVVPNEPAEKLKQYIVTHHNSYNEEASLYKITEKIDSGHFGLCYNFKDNELYFETFIDSDGNLPVVVLIVLDDAVSRDNKKNQVKYMHYEKNDATSLGYAEVAPASFKQGTNISFFYYSSPYGELVKEDDESMCASITSFALKYADDMLKRFDINLKISDFGFIYF